MSEFQKCPKCGGEEFRENALEWGIQSGVRIDAKGHLDYEVAGSIEYSGPTEKAYYTCGGCDSELYLVDGKLTTEEPKEPESELLKIAKIILSNKSDGEEGFVEIEWFYINQLMEAIDKAEGGS